MVQVRSLENTSERTTSEPARKPLNEDHLRFASPVVGGVCFERRSKGTGPPGRHLGVSAVSIAENSGRVGCGHLSRGLRPPSAAIGRAAVSTGWGVAAFLRIRCSYYYSLIRGTPGPDKAAFGQNFNVNQ